MKLFLTCLLAFGHMALAAEWIMGDDTCDPWEAGVRTAAREVQDLAQIALKVMDGKGGEFGGPGGTKGWKPDPKKVEEMAKCILGKDTKFDEKWKKAKENFQALTAYKAEEWKPTDGSKPKYDHAQWVAKPRSNTDAEIYCGHKRLKIKPHERDATRQIAEDPARGNRRIGSEDLKSWIACSDPNSKNGIRAWTSTSDLYDAKAVKGMINPLPNYGYTEVPDLPDSIQIAASTLKSYEPATGAAGSVADASAGWPVITLEKVQDALKRQKKFVKDQKAAIDALKTLGTVLLHEMTHTHTGGKLYDKDLRQNDNDKERRAYDWKKCKEAEDPDNADSMVQLAVAWKVYSLGQFWVDGQGNVAKR